MSRKRLVTFLSILLTVSAVVIFSLSQDWGDKVTLISFAILLFGALGSIIAIFIPTSKDKEFAKGNWIPQLDSSGKQEYRLEFTALKHGMGRKPQLKVLEHDTDESIEDGIVVKIDDKGNVTLYTNVRLDGRIIIYS